MEYRGHFFRLLLCARLLRSRLFFHPQGNLKTETLMIMARKTTTSTPPAAPAKRAVKPAAKKKLVARAKRPAPKPATRKAAAYTSEDVALRAYFISEKRRTDGLPGDEHQDWIEAERQLVAESQPKKKKTVKA